MEIELDWEYAVEWLEIDLEEFTRFSETWERRSDGEVVSWNVSGELVKEGDSFHIIVKYEDDQKDSKVVSYLDDQGEDRLVYLGTNRIIMERDRRRKDGGIKKRGKFLWTPKKDKPWWGRWKTNDIPRDRTVREQTKRDGKFRGNILRLDKKCVITREKTDRALEAAHIVSVKKGGMDSLHNGVILRADIHRLYDGRLFRIDPQSGKPTRLCATLSPRYKKLLAKSKSKLPNKTLNRVKRALEEAWKDSDPDQ